MSRKQSREVAFKILFSLAFDTCADVLSPEILDLACEGDVPNGPENIFINSLLVAVRDNLGLIDEMITKHTEKFALSRLFRADLTALRMCIAEMFFMPDKTPKNVAIDEAINIVKKYSTSKSASYVNGILAQIVAGQTDMQGQTQTKQVDAQIDTQVKAEQADEQVKAEQVKTVQTDEQADKQVKAVQTDVQGQFQAEKTDTQGQSQIEQVDAQEKFRTERIDMQGDVQQSSGEVT